MFYDKVFRSTVPVKNPHDNRGDEIGCQDADPH